MTRDEIMSQFSVDDNGRITDPGKFEGEMLYAPAIYAMIGGGERDGNFFDGNRYTDYIEVTTELRDEFPEIDEEVDFITLSEDDNGFVYVGAYSRDEWEEFMNELSVSFEEEGEDGDEDEEDYDSWN